jgi:hypothetical protein
MYTLAYRRLDDVSLASLPVKVYLQHHGNIGCDVAFADDTDVSFADGNKTKYVPAMSRMIQCDVQLALSG